MPRSKLPHWLQQFVALNPVDHLITALRALMIHGFDGGAVFGSILASLAVGAVTLPLAVRAFRKAVAS